MNNIDFNISELAEGAVQEKIDQEVRKIVANILDVNTAFKPSRKVSSYLESAMLLDAPCLRLTEEFGERLPKQVLPSICIIT